MKYNPDLHHRRSIRLKDHDYSQGGGYFVTICTEGREGLFGEIKNGEMQLNRAGKMVRTVWDNLPERFPEIELDEFMVMPSHIHGIIVINDKNNVDSVCRGEVTSPGDGTGGETPPPPFRYSPSGSRDFSPG